MKNIFLKYILVLILALCVVIFSACTKTDDVNINDNNTDTDTDIVEKLPEEDQNNEEPPVNLPILNTDMPNTEKENTPAKLETVTPKIEGFTIVNVLTFDGSRYSVAELKKDGEDMIQYAIIDIDGNLQFGPTYNYMYWCRDHKVVGIYKDGADQTNVGQYTVTEHWGHGGIFEFCHVKDVQTEKMYTIYGTESGTFASEITEMPSLNPYILYDKGNFAIDADGYLEYGFETELYNGIYSDTERFTYEFCDNRGNPVSLSEYTDIPFSFVGGYLACAENGKYGYIDEHGDKATEFIYESAQTVFDGRAWVKENGQWRVISL